ncbi:MAG TPA: TonB-dependent receptor [Candidatus Margulisiibacteriota bacterium]|nr:TonB-dependent receptor [Candidatus Margulisiibacteriota bacterium]
MVLLATTLSARLAAQTAAPAGAAQGTIAGRVLDRSTGDPIIEAGVEVIQTGKRVRTDLDGKYKLTLPPGTYELRIFAPLYKGTRLQNVAVRANSVTTADANLLPEQKASVEVVEVVAQADKAAEATQLLERKNSPVVSDNLSAESIKKSPGSNAGEMVKRVPAVTIQNNKYVFVRGLGERYSGAVLNNSRLPSTDPNRRIVPMDLFPADFIQSLNVLKSYTPDLPGDFSGGLVDIRLKDYPEQLSYTLGATAGGNTYATFKSLQTYHGSQFDYFGGGNGFRSLPGSIPTQLLGTPSLAQGRVYASAFNDIWNVQSEQAAPNYGLNFSVGDSKGPVGAQLGGIYTTEYKARPNELAQNFANAKSTAQGGGFELTPAGNLAGSRDTFETRLGGVWTSAWQPSATDKVTFRALVNQSTFDEVLNGTGCDRNQIAGTTCNQTIAQYRLQYTLDRLGYGQLGGEHHVDGIDVNWRTALSETVEDQPDTRFVSYNLFPNQPRQINAANDPGSESLERLFGSLEEHLSDSAVDFTTPFKTGLPFTDVWAGLPAKLKFGTAYSYRHRTFDFRRFLYDRITYVGIDPSDPAGGLLVPENIGVNFRFREGTRPKDSFTASQDIAAGYSMVDLPILPGTHGEAGQLLNQLRLVAGTRVEYSYIATQSFNDLNEPVQTTINEIDPLPGINLIYSPHEETNVRLGYSRTVSRPEFRELTPTEFPVPNGERTVIGNPFLTSATIDSVDLRWERFLSPLELLSAGFFYKHMSNPIEQIVIGQSDGEADSWKNAQDATLWGFEWEARKNFGFLTAQYARLHLDSGEWLSHLNLVSNVAYINSTVNVGTADLNDPLCREDPRFCVQVQTSASRSLQGQAPYVVNAVAEYEIPAWQGVARLLYNTVGERIVAAGTGNLPDINEQPRNQLDFILIGKINPFGTPLTAKFAAENIFNDAYRQTQGDEVVHRYRTGVKFTFGISYTY